MRMSQGSAHEPRQCACAEAVAGLRGCRASTRCVAGCGGEGRCIAVCCGGCLLRREAWEEALDEGTLRLCRVVKAAALEEEELLEVGEDLGK